MRRTGVFAFQQELQSGMVRALCTAANHTAPPDQYRLSQAPVTGFGSASADLKSEMPARQAVSPHRYAGMFNPARTVWRSSRLVDGLSGLSVMRVFVKPTAKPCSGSAKPIAPPNPSCPKQVWRDDIVGTLPPRIYPRPNPISRPTSVWSIAQRCTMVILVTRRGGNNRVPFTPLPTKLA